MLHILPDNLKFMAAVAHFGDYAMDRLWDNEYFPDEVRSLASEVMGEPYPDGDWTEKSHEAYENKQAEVVDELYTAWVTCEYYRLQKETK